MTMATPAAVEAEIHAIMKDRIEAVHAKDAARLVSHHAADVVAYDLLEPLQYKGAGDLRRRAQHWFDGYDGPMTYEIRDLVVVPGHGVAFCHGLHHVAGRLRRPARSRSLSSPEEMQTRRPRHEGGYDDEEDRHPASEGGARRSLSAGRVSGIRNHTVARANIATTARPMKAAGLPNVSLM